MAGWAGSPRCSSRRSRPSVSSSGWWAALPAGVVARGIVPWTSASARHNSSLGCGSHRCRSWWVASASSSSTSVHASRVCPNSDSRAGRSPGPSAAGRRSSRGGRAEDRRRTWPPVPATVPAARPGRRRGRLIAVQPVDQQLRTLPGVGGEQPASRRATEYRRPGAARPRPRRCRSGPDALPACGTTARPGRVDYLQQRPRHTSGDHGSSSAVPVISAISEPGLRNATPAHTPSPPRPQPRTCESR